MVGRKNKKKGKTSQDNYRGKLKTHFLKCCCLVEKALLPTPVFAAVPLSGTAPAALASSSPAVSKSANISLATRSSGSPSQPPLPMSPQQDPQPPRSPVDDFSEPESSLFDYQQMVDSGNDMVGFGTWPARGNPSRRDPPSSQPQFRPSGHYAELGEFEDIKESPQRPETAEYDIYATPVKKGKGKSSLRKSTGSDHTDDQTLTATQRNVRAEMKRIHEQPQEVNETMTRSVNQAANLSSNHPGSSQFYDSGRGSTRPASVGEDESRLHVEDRRLVQSLTGASFSEQMSTGRVTVLPQVRSGAETVSPQPSDEMISPSCSILDRIMATNHTLAHGQPLSGRSSHSQRSISLRDKDLIDEAEQHNLRMENAELRAEIHSLKKVMDAVDNGDGAISHSLLVQKQVEELKKDNEELKSAVHRLNVELSDYQAKYRPTDQNQLRQVIEVHGLPSTGPVPSWLISKKYLSPLFLAYDDQLAKKDELIEECRKECAALRNRVEQVVSENQTLRRMGGGSGLGGHGDSTEWRQLQEQARLVLEENQVLMEQLEVQNHKSKDLYQAQLAEISRLTRKLAHCEGEKVDLERSLGQAKARFQDLNYKYEQTLLETESRVKSNISGTGEREHVEKEIETLRIKLKASEEERKSQAKQMIELTAENQSLKVEVKAVKKSVWLAQEKILLLQKAMELSENKEMISQEQLANVIKVAEKTALERDTVYKVAREQQEESKLTQDKMIKDSASVGKLELKLKLFQVKASAKLNALADKLIEQDEAFNSQKKEYEREIQHLRCLVKEKEEIIASLLQDKRDVDLDMDTMWQAAASENKRIRNILLSGGRKLRDHAQIAEAIKAEMESEEVLHFSEADKRRLPFSDIPPLNSAEEDWNKDTSDQDSMGKK